MTFTNAISRTSGKLFAVLMYCIPPLTLAIAISKAGVLGGVAGVCLVFVLYFLFAVFKNYRVGYLMLTVFGFLMFQFYRLLPEAPYVPLGVGVEIILALLFFSIITHSIGYSSDFENSKKDLFQNPITCALAIYVAYSLLILFHPSSKAVTGRIMAAREITALAILFFVSLHVFRSRRYINLYLDFWIFFALVAALYGIYQEVFGLQDWELRWLYAQPDQGKLAIVWGHIRKWSFLSDINSFGLLMSYGGIVCLILALGPFSTIKKIYFACCSVLMLTAMTFSGTRTAMAMVVFGFAFFVVITLNQVRSIALVAGFCIAILTLYFGPFYGPNFNRLRSTFDLKRDASMSVRDQTRARVQPYVRAHAFGGGFYTSGALGLKYDPDHVLAGKWDPDSGYLRTALERGWVGLLIQLGLHVTILVTGLTLFFKTTNPVTASISCAYLCGFFALSVANYAQDSLEQKPTNLILMSSFATFINLMILEKKNGTN